jgi:hypothetical protein
MSGRDCFIAKVEQSGGKHGDFECPVCGGWAEYKFSASAGGCPDCGAVFVYVGGPHLFIDPPGRFESAHWIELQKAA